jgi:hypothetical protein
MAGSDPVRTGPLGGGGDIEPTGLVSIAVGGSFRGDLDLERNILSVVLARASDRAWKGSGIEKDRGDRGSGAAGVGDVGENAEGDIGGLTLLGIVEDEVGDTIGFGSERSEGVVTDFIATDGFWMADLLFFCLLQRW